MKRLLVALILTIISAAVFACGSDDSAPTADETTPMPTPQAVAPTPQATAPPFTPVESGDDKKPEQPTEDDGSDGYSGQSSSSSSEDDDDSDEHTNGDDDSDDKSSDADSGEHKNGDSDDDTVVSRENPGFIGMGFDVSRNDALADADSIDAVTWDTQPAASAGALDAKGTLSGGASIFNPMVDGEGAGFIVYFKGNDEPFALLLPDPGPMYMWDTYHTVADMEHEFEANSFVIRAYSPLFMDIGPDDLEIRVFGFDGNGNDALLSVHPVTSP